jgi:hypothetical protein
MSDDYRYFIRKEKRALIEFGFGTAIDYLKQGKKVTRLGWNGNRFPPIIEPAPKYEPKNRVEYVEKFDLTYIRLSDGNIAVCDGSEFEKVSLHKWTSYKGKYAFYTNNSKKENVRLHNYIFGILPNNYVVDHINGNGLDCRSVNMRIATHKDNNMNRISKSHTSQYKGVSWDLSRNKWIVSIQTDGKTIHIGRFDDEIEAAKAYDRKAWELFGQYAKLNFPNDELPPRMFLYYVPAAAYPPCTDIAKEAFGGNDVPYGAYIAMKTVQGNVIPWSASQTDLLSMDWVVVK